MVIVVLMKVFVREFFRLNAGFFLVVLGIAFGFMSGIEHMALAQFFMSSPTSACIPLLLWLMYAWKVVSFNAQVTRKRGNEFLRHFSFLSKTEQWLCVIRLFASQFSPAIAYGVFLGSVAIRLEHLLPVAVITIGLLAISLVGAGSLRYRLNHPDEERKVTRLKYFIDRTFVRQYPQFFIGLIGRRSIGLVLGTKIFVCLLIWSTVYVYSDEYDWRLLGMGLTVAFGSQSVLIFQYHRFENYYFQLLRNFPLTIGTRMVNFLVMMLVMSLPEFLFLTGKFPLHLGVVNWGISVLYGISIWMLIYGFLYRADISLEQLIQRTFVFSLSAIVLILFGLPPLVLVVANGIIGYMWLRKYFYSFEFVASIESEK